MALYITVSRGERADTARPVLAISDRSVIDAVLSAIRQLEADSLSTREQLPPSGHEAEIRGRSALSEGVASE